MESPFYTKPKISILCAEDDHDTMALLIKMISQKYPDVELFTAENGKTGLELYKNHEPNIVITDIRMPLLDGIQMAAEIKAIDPETIIIVVSAYSDTQYMLNAIEIGVNYYVIKPIDHQKIFSAIEKSITGINLLWKVKEQEAAIERLASFTQINPNPVIETDTSGNITYFNEAAEKIVRIAGGSKDLTLFLPADLQELLKKLRKKETLPFYREVYINSACFGEIIYYARQFNAVRIYATDITEHKKLQDELLKAQNLESLGVLAGGIAHDFNNLLTGILGNLSLARMQIDPEHGVVRRLEECEKAAIQARDLTHQLLTFARGGEPVKKLISPALLVREAASFILRGSNVKSVIEMADNLWCVEADSGQLNQVLHNILINAAQSMLGGGNVTIRAVNETLKADNPHQLPPGDYIGITIGDHGCGISEENLSKIFDPYFTTKPKGSGLGLSSVYSIVKKHGGTVEVSSTVGVGSTFTIHLPARPCVQSEDKVVKTACQLTGNGRILIMDDEDFIREIATDILEFMGYQVESCSNGREAVERFRTAMEINVAFDAVILDLTIPGGMGGKEAAALLLEIEPEAVLIVSSGYSSDPVISNYRQHGFSGAISKPFDTDTLARELGRLISRKC